MTTIHPVVARVGAPAPKNRTAKRWLRTLAWIFPILAIAGAATFYLRYRQAHAPSPVHYTTGAIDRGPISARVTANGTVSALVTVLVGSQVSGRIETLGADFGTAVKKGQVIATIEPSFFRAAVAQARANFVSAKSVVEKIDAQSVQADRRYDRAKSLFEEGVASKADLETAEADRDVTRSEQKSAKAGVAQAAAALEQAELNLKYTKIISPIDGVVISRNVDVGQTVAAALQAPTIFTIAQDLTRMQVDTNVAEADVGKIRPGMSVTFTVDAQPGRIFDGKVRQVRDAAQTIQNVVTYDAVIDIDNTERLLKPGMTASITFVHATRLDAQRIPNAALRFQPDDPTLAAMLGGTTTNKPTLKSDERTVWLLRDGKPIAVVAHIGLTDGTLTELRDGDFKDGDQVVIEASIAGASKS